MITNAHATSLDTINKFLKVQYSEGFREEINGMEALFNVVRKEPLTAKYKEIDFGNGIVDTVRAMGPMWDNEFPSFSSDQNVAPKGRGYNNPMSNPQTDKYELGLADLEFNTGPEFVTARFDVTKFLATFSLTDEAVLVGTSDGSLFNSVQENLKRMALGIKHTQQRMTYGSYDGLIGTLGVHGTNPRVAVERVQGKIVSVVKVFVDNIHSLVEGMTIMIKKNNDNYLMGKVWQKVHKTVTGTPYVKLLVDKYAATVEGTEGGTATSDHAGFKTCFESSKWDAAEIYSRQFQDAVNGVKREYHGLEDILFRHSDSHASTINFLFGIDLTEYENFRPTVEDADNNVLDEQDLDLMRDHIDLTYASDTSIDLVATTHKVVNAIKANLYNPVNSRYDVNENSKTMEMGRKDLVHDGFLYRKDKFARSGNVAMLDTALIGELVRKDFDWITSGSQQGVLERRDGTEIYEGIMTKYADFYVESFRAHAGYINVNEG